MNEPRGTRYQRLRRRAQTIAVTSAAVVLAGLALTPASAHLADWVRGATVSWPLAVRPAATSMGFVALVVVLCGLATVPARLHAALRVEPRYRPEEPSAPVGAWHALLLESQYLLLLLPVLWLAGALVQLSAWVGGAFWWLLGGGLLAATLALAMRCAPLIVARVAGTRSLDRSELAERVAALAVRSGVPVAGLHEISAEAAPRATAFVAGFGRTRRVFISSEIVAHWQPDEIDVVVAHELGHYARQDLWRTLALDAATVTAALAVADRTLAAFGGSLDLSGPVDIAALPLVALVAGTVWIATTPVRFAQSRRQERAADGFALALTGSATAFDRAIRRLGARHLAEERPSLVARWMFHRHPPVAERLEFGQRFAVATGATADGHPAEGSRAG